MLKIYIFQNNLKDFLFFPYKILFIGEKKKKWTFNTFENNIIYVKVAKVLWYNKDKT